jgi:hypothetical protein
MTECVLSVELRCTLLLGFPDLFVLLGWAGLVDALVMVLQVEPAGSLWSCTGSGAPGPARTQQIFLFHKISPEEYVPWHGMACAKTEKHYQVANTKLNIIAIKVNCIAIKDI